MNCDKCKYFVKLTQKEIDLLEKKLDFSKIRKDKKDKLSGVCLRNNFDLSFLLVKKFVFEIENTNCPYFEEGEYEENWDIFNCPECGHDKLVIKRQYLKSSQKFIINFKCENIECGFKTFTTVINRNCSVCGGILELWGGEIMSSYCKNCKKTKYIPISLNIWPQLVLPKGGCVHIPYYRSCEKCNESRRRNTSLIEIEFPIYCNQINKKTNFEKSKLNESKSNYHNYIEYDNLTPYDFDLYDDYEEELRKDFEDQLLEELCEDEYGTENYWDRREWIMQRLFFKWIRKNPKDP